MAIATAQFTITQTVGLYQTNITPPVCLIPTNSDYTEPQFDIFEFLVEAKEDNNIIQPYLTYNTDVFNYDRSTGIITIKYINPDVNIIRLEYNFDFFLDEGKTHHIGTQKLILLKHAASLDSYSAALQNPNEIVAVDHLGVVPTNWTCSTDIYAFYGLTPLTYKHVNPGKGNFKASIEAVNCTSSLNETTGKVTVSNLTEDSAYVIIKFFMEGAVAPFISLNFSITKVYGGKPGQDGEQGPSMSFYGEFSLEKSYPISKYHRAIVFEKNDSGKKFYFMTKLRNDLGVEFKGQPLTNKDYWEPFGSNYQSIATGLLFSEIAYIGNLTSEGIIIGDVGKTDGWILNKSVIKSRSEKTTLTEDGRIIANDAEISGTVTVGNAGVNGHNEIANPIRFYAGTSPLEKENAPFKVYDDGTIKTSDMFAADINLSGQITGPGFTINELYAQFNEIVANKLTINEGVFKSGKVGQWDITSNGFSSGVAADIILRDSENITNTTISEATGDYTLNLGVPFNDFVDFGTMTAPNNITIPSTSETYNIQFPSLNFNGYNDLAKDGRKYSQFEFKIVLNFTIGAKIFTLESNSLAISGQDSASKNTYFQLNYTPPLVTNVTKGSIISNIKYSVKYTKKRISDNATGSGKGRLHTLKYELSDQATKFRLIIFPVSKIAVINPDRFEIKKSENERFTVYYQTINGKERLKIDLLGDLSLQGQLGNVDLNDYYHAGNSNNATTDWAAKNVTASGDITAKASQAVVFTANDIVGGSQYLHQLLDVEIPTPKNGDALMFDSVKQKWVNISEITFDGGTYAIV